MIHSNWNCYILKKIIFKPLWNLETVSAIVMEPSATSVNFVLYRMIIDKELKK